MLAGALNTAPEVGLVRLTAGNALTRIDTTVEVVVAPRSSVATAVRLYVPAARPERLTLYGAVVAVPTRVAPR